MQTVVVKSALPQTPDGGFPIAIFDRHEEYKDGELFIADDKTHTVPMTGEVAKALTDGRLMQPGQANESVIPPATDPILEPVTTDKKVK